MLRNASSILEGRTILLVSPQNWEHISVSKHHYAFEAASRGASVWFVEPPITGRPGRIETKVVSEGIKIVRHSLPVSNRILFRAPNVFDLVTRRHMRRLGQTVGSNGPDLVWCFEPTYYRHLNLFGGGMTIFHTADPFSTPRQINVSKTANLILSVSDQILDIYKNSGVPRAFVNHGLSTPFEQLARSVPASRNSASVQVGYAGNLTSPSFNRPIVNIIVNENPDITFNFWGPAHHDDPLGNYSNVKLNGILSTRDLARCLSEIDILLLCYRKSRWYDKSNSHKLLEYLSTGRPVVGSRLSQYRAEWGDLYVASDDEDDETLSAKFRWVVENLTNLNAPELVARRQRFALDHTYARQLDRVSALVGAVAPRGSSLYQGADMRGLTTPHMSLQRDGVALYTDQSKP